MFSVNMAYSLSLVVHWDLQDLHSLALSTTLHATTRPTTILAVALPKPTMLPMEPPSLPPEVVSSSPSSPSLGSLSGSSAGPIFLMLSVMRTTKSTPVLWVLPVLIGVLTPVTLPSSLVTNLLSLILLL